MTNEQLFQALAGVKPEYLDHSEGGAKPRRKIMPRSVLVAAVMALLICTAAAIPYIQSAFSRMYELLERRPGVVVDHKGETHVFTGMLDVRVELDIQENRPKYIKQAYVPMYFVENWEMTQQERDTIYQNITYDNDTLLMWHTDDGQEVSFAQRILDDSVEPDCVEYPLDVVNIGYNEYAEIEKVQFGEYDLWRLEVPPASMDVDGTTYTSPGHRYYYWSDGYYYFVLTLNWETDEAVVQKTLDSLAPVEDVTEYQLVEYVKHYASPQQEPKEMVLYPTWLPEGYRRWVAQVDGNGDYYFFWDYLPPDEYLTSSIHLYQDSNASDINHFIVQWTLEGWEGTRETHSIQGWDVTIFYNEYNIDAFWNVDGVDYTLRGNGPKFKRISNEEFIRIIENMTLVENAVQLLEEPKPEVPLYPQWMPEGWELLREEESEGYYSFVWQHNPSFSRIYLEQYPHGDYGWRRIWSSMGEHQTETLHIQGWEITVCSNEFRTDVFWSVGNTDYVLSITGEHHISRDDLIRILESMEEMTYGGV